MSLQLLKSRITAIPNQRVLSTKYDNEHRSKTDKTWKKVNRNEFKSNLSHYEQVTINTPDFKNAIIFDVDDPQEFILPDTVPYWQTYNKSNDKHHVGYLLEEPIYTKSEKQKAWYNSTIRPMIVKTAWLINADGNYKNTTTKNPFNEHLFHTKEIGSTLNNVWDLLSQYNDSINSLTVIETNNKADGRYLSDKYKKVISELIEHSQMNTKLLFKDLDQFKRVMQLKASMLSDDMPELKKESAKSLCNDVISYSIAWSKKVSEAQSKRSLIANQKRWGNQVEENKKNITNAIIDLLARDIKPTLSNISLCVSLSAKTLKNSYSIYIKSEKIRLQLRR